MNHPAGSATGIDLAEMETKARRGDYITRAEQLALITLARATPQHPDEVVAWVNPRDLETDTHIDCWSHKTPNYTVPLYRHPATPQHSVTEQASSDTDELRRLVNEYRNACDMVQGHAIPQWRKIVAYLDSRAQPLASTAADFPDGAIHNGEALASWLENIYDFQCEAGPLRNCSEWIELRRCINVLVDYARARASTAATQPEQGAVIRLLREARAALETWKDVAPAVSLCADIDAALAIPASTAASEQQSSRTVFALKRDSFVSDTGFDMYTAEIEGWHEKCHTTISSDAASEQQAGADELPPLPEPVSLGWNAATAGVYGYTAEQVQNYARAALPHRATTAPGYKLVPIERPKEWTLAAERAGVSFSTQQKCWAAWFAAAPGIATTAADQQGARAIDALDGMGYTYDVEIGWLPPAQQGAAQAQAGDVIPEQRNVLSIERYGDAGATVVFRSCRAASAFMTTVRAAMAAPATSGGKA